MADRRNRRWRFALLLVLTAAAGAGTWVVRRWFGSGRPVRDEWAGAVATTVGVPEPTTPAESRRSAGVADPAGQASDDEPVPDGPYGPGSAAPLPDGSAPSPEFTIKANATSKLFHPPSSPYFRRTKPAAWFRTAEDAERAGFTEWKPKPRGT